MNDMCLCFWCVQDRYRDLMDDSELMPELPKRVYDERVDIDPKVFATETFDRKYRSKKLYSPHVKGQIITNGMYLHETKEEIRKKVPKHLSEGADREEAWIRYYVDKTARVGRKHWNVYTEKKRRKKITKKKNRRKLREIKF